MVLTPKPSAQWVRENSLPRHGWPRCSMLNRASMAVAGILDSSNTRCRRISIIVGTCSTSTGHSSMHAPHDTQSQMASSATTPPINSLASGESTPFLIPSPTSSRWSFISSTTCMGERILPLIFAGQTSVHRPHTAQA